MYTVYLGEDRRWVDTEEAAAGHIPEPEGRPPGAVQDKLLEAGEDTLLGVDALLGADSHPEAVLGRAEQEVDSQRPGLPVLPLFEAPAEGKVLEET